MDEYPEECRTCASPASSETLDVTSVSTIQGGYVTYVKACRLVDFLFEKSILKPLLVLRHHASSIYVLLGLLGFLDCKQGLPYLQQPLFELCAM